MTRVVTAGELNRATLARQLLLGRERLDVVDAVRRAVALQAQQPESPYLAQANRLDGFDPATLDAAFAQFAVVKATLMRITLHAVHAADREVFLVAMLPTLRAARLDARFSSSGLRPEDADALVPGLLEFAATARSTAEVQQWLAGRLGPEPHPAVWRALRSFAPLVHQPTGGPWSFGQRPSYVTASGAPDASPDACAEALQVLVRRYLEGFGPASIADVAQFATVQRGRVRAAVQGLGGTVREIRGPDGSTLYDVPGGPIPAADTPAPPRLMAMWD
ncbi:MAG: DNA glycosylase AlkZ-like family protein, partial [Thermocrispum sp.]